MREVVRHRELRSVRTRVLLLECPLLGAGYGLGTTGLWFSPVPRRAELIPRRVDDLPYDVETCTGNGSMLCLSEE